MNASTQMSDPFENFLNAFVDELIATPDEQVLEDADAVAVQAAGLRLLGLAKAEASKRRLAAAKAGFEASTSRGGVLWTESVSADEARRYVQLAANDRRYTLAARKLEELSDEDVLRLYRQMKQLDDDGGSDNAEPT